MMTQKLKFKATLESFELNSSLFANCNEDRVIELSELLKQFSNISKVSIIGMQIGDHLMYLDLKHVPEI